MPCRAGNRGTQMVSDPCEVMLSGFGPRWPLSHFLASKAERSCLKLCLLACSAPPCSGRQPSLSWILPRAARIHLCPYVLKI